MNAIAASSSTSRMVDLDGAPDESLMDVLKGGFFATVAMPDLLKPRRHGAGKRSHVAA